MGLIKSVIRKESTVMVMENIEAAAYLIAGTITYGETHAEYAQRLNRTGGFTLEFGVTGTDNWLQRQGVIFDDEELNTIIALAENIIGRRY
jgi:hypothetical protein